MGGLLFPTGEGLGQGRMPQKSPTLKMCNNRKLNSAVTLKKGDDVIAWDTPLCFPFAIGPARASRKSFYVHAGTFSTAWGKIPRCQNPLSPPSQLSRVLCAVSTDGYPHRILELLVTPRNSNIVQITAGMFREQNVPLLADGCSPQCPIITT